MIRPSKDHKLKSIRLPIFFGKFKEFRRKLEKNKRVELPPGRISRVNLGI